MFRKNNILKLTNVFAVLFLIFCLLSVNALASTPAHSNETPYETYTYWEGLGTKEKTKSYVKPMYAVKKVIDSSSLNIPLFESVDDICTANGYSYILDSASSNIHILDSEYKLVKTINHISYMSKELKITGASGIFVKDNQIYIADTKHARVLVIDGDGNVIHNLKLPKSKLIPKNFKYTPVKVSVDSKNYLYIASDGSYYGALVYSPDMEFLGFYGANTVAVSVGEVVKNFITNIFSTDAKRAASVRSLPYQFTDFALGPNDFVYTVTSTADDKTSVGQVKRLNPGGKDVLKRENYNFADDSSRLLKPESLKSIDVDSDGFFYLLDVGVYNRVFWYDKESNLMCIFAGSSTYPQKGTFSLGGSIAVNGTDILVSDPMNKSVTVFSITEYGKLVRDTQLDTLNDEFEKTFSNWEKVKSLDANNQLAYKGLAKAYYTKGDYSKALKYAKTGADRQTYADAFVKIRTIFLEKNFTLIVLGLVLLVGLVVAVSVISHKKKGKLIKNEKIIVMLSSVFHPFNSFDSVKRKNSGSLVIATVILCIYYAVFALKDTAMGFAFNSFDASSYNSLFVLLRTVALVLLFVVSNWLVCVLLGGIGKLKEIFIVTCYSLIPIIVSSIVSIILSHILSPDEFVFVTIFESICIGYTFFILAIGIMKIHDYEFGKFVGTTIVTLIAMIIIVFLVFLVFMLAQQVYGWICTIITELKYR